jgi:hypothetical protein
MSACKDRTGQRFSRWVAIERVGNGKNGRVRWRCRCDCGVTRNVLVCSLVNKTSRSCGCLNREVNAARHAIYKGMASRNRLTYQYKASAKKRGFQWTLTNEEAHQIFESNCYYCGTSPKQIFKAKECNGSYVYNGIDRVDTSRGYTLDNCVPCCWTCNCAKRKMSSVQFLAWIRSVYVYRVHRQQPCTRVS